MGDLPNSSPPVAEDEATIIFSVIPKQNSAVPISFWGYTVPVFANQRAIETLVVRATVGPNSTLIGALAAQLVLRVTHSKEIMEQMQSQKTDFADLAKMAQTIFAKAGELRKSHRARVWGESLGDGVFLYVDYIQVERLYRKHGLAQRLLQELFDGARTWTAQLNPPLSIEWAFVFPCGMSCSTILAWARADEYEQLHQTLGLISTQFFRKQGFRRVGTTKYLAYAFDPTHPSHYLPALQDHWLAKHETFPRFWPLYHQIEQKEIEAENRMEGQRRRATTLDGPADDDNNASPDHVNSSPQLPAAKRALSQDSESEDEEHGRTPHVNDSGYQTTSPEMEMGEDATKSLIPRSGRVAKRVRFDLSSAE